MSNHASVILTFSGIDSAACPRGLDDISDDYGQRRCAEIGAFLKKAFHCSPSCSSRTNADGSPREGSIGMACEVVMLFHHNHFYPGGETDGGKGHVALWIEQSSGRVIGPSIAGAPWTYKDGQWDAGSLMAFLATLEWEYPDEVEVFWKTENNNQYRRVALAPRDPERD